MPAPTPGDKDHPREVRVRRWLASARSRFEGSWVQDLGTRLKRLDFGNAIVLLGAALLLSVLPLIILLSSLANERIDDDLSRHIGLDGRGAHIIAGLFRSAPAHSAGPIALGLITAFAGSMSVASSLQSIYEGVYDQEHRGWHDFPRFLAWVGAMLAALIVEGVLDGPIHAAAGPVVLGLASFLGLAVFFWWTMHFLLAGRVSWRLLIRPAVVTALLWLGLAVFSSIYFSSALIEEHRLYGTIGVVFILMAWLIAIGAVVVLGAAGGAVWQARADRGSAAADSG